MLDKDCPVDKEGQVVGKGVASVVRYIFSKDEADEIILEVQEYYESQGIRYLFYIPFAFFWFSLIGAYGIYALLWLLFKIT